VNNNFYPGRIAFAQHAANGAFRNDDPFQEFQPVKEVPEMVLHLTATPQIISNASYVTKSSFKKPTPFGGTII
jgi:hypothetical protein